MTHSKSQFNQDNNANDNPALMQALKERQVQDPILQDLNSYIEILRKSVVSEGTRQLKRITTLYQHYIDQSNAVLKKVDQTPT